MLLNRWDHRAHHWYKSKGEFWVCSLQDRNFGQPNTNVSWTGRYFTESRLNPTLNSNRVTFLLYCLLLRPFRPHKCQPCSSCCRLACPCHPFLTNNPKTPETPLYRARPWPAEDAQKLDLSLQYSRLRRSQTCGRNPRERSQWCRGDSLEYLLVLELRAVLSQYKYWLVFYVPSILKKNKMIWGQITGWRSWFIYKTKDFQTQLFRYYFTCPSCCVYSPQSRPYSTDLEFKSCCQLIVCCHNFPKVKRLLLSFVHVVWQSKQKYHSPILKVTAFWRENKADGIILPGLF